MAPMKKKPKLQKESTSSQSDPIGSSSTREIPSKLDESRSSSSKNNASSSSFSFSVEKTASRLDLTAIKSKLRQLIKRGRHAKLKKTIEANKAALHYSDQSLDALLFDAIRAKHNNVECVRVLLENIKRFKLSVPNRTLGTPLHVAAKLRSTEKAYAICKLLVDHGADVTVVGRNQIRTPLDIVCARRNCPAKLVKLLISKASLRAGGHVKSSFVIAIETGNVEALRTLFDVDEQCNGKFEDYEVVRFAIAAVSTRQRREKRSDITDNMNKADNTSDLLNVIFEYYPRAIGYRSGLEEEEIILLCNLIDNKQLEFAKQLLDADVNPLTLVSLRAKSAPFDFGSPPPSTSNHSQMRNKFASEHTQMRNALESALHRTADEAFELVCDYITPERIAAASAALAIRNPLMLALKLQNAKRFGAMLDLGFEFRTFDTELTRSSVRLERLQFANSHLYSQLIPYRRARMLSLVLLESVAGSVNDFVTALLEHPCEVNAVNGNEMPPLIALALLMCAPFDSPKKHYSSMRIFFTLLVKKGANPFYTSSLFRVETPDLCIFASLFSEMPFFIFLMTRIGFSSLKLLLDLKAQIDNPRVANELKCRKRRRKVLRQRLAAVAQLSLLLSANSGAVKRVCRDLDALTAAADGNDADRQVFRRVNDDSETVPSLKCMCRAVIRDRIGDCSRSNEPLEKQIDKLNFPGALKQFLKHADVSDKMLVRQFAAESVLRLTAAGWFVLRGDASSDSDDEVVSDDSDEGSSSSDDSDSENCDSDEDAEEPGTKWTSTIRALNQQLVDDSDSRKMANGVDLDSVESQNPYDYGDFGDHISPPDSDAVEEEEDSSDSAGSGRDADSDSDW